MSWHSHNVTRLKSTVVEESDGSGPYAVIGVLSRQFGSTWNTLHESCHGIGTDGLLSVPSAFWFYKAVFGMQEKRSVPLCLLERYFSNDATGHIAFPGVSYILPPVPSMSLITLFPCRYLSSSDVIFWTDLYLSAPILISKSDTLSVWRFSWPLLQKYKITPKNQFAQQA